MSRIKVSAVNLIKRNLQDRYKSGYPILKELLQNADDAQSRRFRIDACSGWPEADNPLFKWPGLLAINDGVFNDADRDGIVSLGESVKADDRATIGKFGLGQKAVFHLCDAFVVHVGGSDPFIEVVNPYLDVNNDGNVTQEWDCINNTDADLLERAGQDFGDRAFILWLPFRRNELFPVPGGGFTTLQPDSETIVKEMARTDDLRVLLTTLRHLKSIEICHQGQTICSVSVGKAQNRLCGPHDSPCTRSFHGTIVHDTIDGSAASWKFVGREATAQDGDLKRLRCSDHWPTTESEHHAESVPEKGEQHGAVTLLRDETQQSELEISWAVFLPISDPENKKLPIGGDVGRIQLLLHGYFFIDSGRRRIEGLADYPSKDEPTNETELCHAWNTKLRDTVVLPLIPALLKDALDQEMMNDQELVYLVRCIVESHWFRSNRAAICKKKALVRVLQPKVPRVSWCLVPTSTKLRSLPKILSETQKQIDQLFEDIDRWAQDREITLCIDRSVSLTAQEMQWTEDELGSLFTKLSPKALQSEPLAALLTNLLTEAELNEERRDIIAPHLVNAFRKAMILENPLAPYTHLKRILQDVPRNRLFALPSSVQLREILRALALSGAKILPVRRELLDTEDQSPPTKEDLKELLSALDPIISNDNDDRLQDQASAAALALLDGHDISILATENDFWNINILRARNPLTPPNSRRIVLSFAELIARSEQLSLFRHEPDVESRLCTLVGALPKVQPLVVYTNLLDDLTCTANKETFLTIINQACKFGPESKRAQMIRLLARLGDVDDTDALRKLCAGQPNPERLWKKADNLPTELKRIIKLLIEHQQNEFLVPHSIVKVLPEEKMQELEIKTLDTPSLERLIEYSVHMFRALSPNESERKALLKIDLSNDLLQRLPIHDRSDGTVDSATDLFWEDEGWPVPDQLRQRIFTIELSEDPEVQSRQKEIVPRWSPIAQIKIALSQQESHRYQEVILQGIAQLCQDNEELPQDLIEQLRTTSWLDIDGETVTPEVVLTLPKPVDEVAEQHDFSELYTVHRLPNRIRQHQGFAYVKRHMILDQRSSVDKLAQMIDVSRLQGRLGSAEHYPLESFTKLANMRIDLKLPGWPLLATVLSSIDSELILDSQVIQCFHEISETDWKMAGEHLEALAKVVVDDLPNREPAEKAYCHGFRTVAQWTEGARCKVFGNTRVPTKSGDWCSGNEVACEINGVAPNYVLADEYAGMLPKGASYKVVRQSQGDDANGTDEEREEDELDIKVLRQYSDTQHREFLKDWQGQVPSELVAFYLGIAGRHNNRLDDYRKTWISDVAINFEEIDQKIEEINTIPALFLIKKLKNDELVEVIALSGDRICLPLSGSELIVGNLHEEKRFLLPIGGQGRKTKLITLQVQTFNLQSIDNRVRVQKFHKFVETAAECVSNDSNDMENVRQILDRVSNVSQTTLEDTEYLLLDLLPGLLEDLKLPPGSARNALKKYKDDVLRRKRENASRMASYDFLKQRLWNSISSQSAAEEILKEVRARIIDRGYSRSRVLFELFQNADDAYVQWHHDLDYVACFRVYFDEGRLRIVHWGRPINHLGLNPTEGRCRGYDYDLFNMLAMNFSEKRPETGLTGKFGLGFKCVHLISDSVGIASGFSTALRTVGGILPELWRDGSRLAEAESLDQPTKATVIDVPYTNNLVRDERTEQAFLETMTWLPAFARRIRRIEIHGSRQETVKCSVSSPTANNKSIDVVTIRDHRRQEQRALRFDLGNDYSLLLKIGAEGPECFEPSVKRVWNLAPLEEEMRSGWLLNGPFPVDPGRVRLAGESEDRAKRFSDIGQALGKRLLELYDLVKDDRDWETLASALALNPDSNARWRFWCGLFDVMRRDLDDELARCLHAANRGYGRLVAERPVVPTRLREPFDELVCASSECSFTDKALASVDILEATRGWKSAGRLKGRIVDSEVGRTLKGLGFDLQPITLLELLRTEMGDAKHIDVDIGTRLGQVIRQAAIEKEPLRREHDDILQAARQSIFRAQDNTWQPVSELSSKHGNDDETRLCGFAPDDALLHEEYQDDSLEFFKVARSQSGYSPTPQLLYRWIESVDNGDESRKLAILKYLVHGRQGPALAQLLRNRRPNWMENVHALLPLLDTDEEKKKLILLLKPCVIVIPDAPDPPPPVPVEEPPVPVENILSNLYDWWQHNSEEERNSYASSVYPEGFNHQSLSNGPNGINRKEWFTMLALACYQSFGRAQDEQHRSFIEHGWNKGWWGELAESMPPNDFKPWRDRLEGWSVASRFDQRFHQWERMLVDLYAIARYLNVYVDLILKLPQLVEKYSGVSLDGILAPSYSSQVQDLGLDAAPIFRSLGIGANWLIRELSRNGVYNSSEAKLMAPYCWAPTQRVRNFLMTLDPDLNLTADKDQSPKIYQFMIEHIGDGCALFDGDFDLPLQLVTRKRHREHLNYWFVGAGLQTPEFGEDNEDYS